MLIKIRTIQIRTKQGLTVLNKDIHAVSKYLCVDCLFNCTVLVKKLNTGWETYKAGSDPALET